MNFNNFIQLNNVIYKLIHIIKKKNKNILSIFIVEVSLNVNEIILNDSEDVQMKKLIKNDNTIELIKNNDIVLSIKNNNIVKSINYDDLMNTTFESLTHMTID